MKLKLVSSLEKCFLDDNIDLKNEYNSASCLKNEIFRFGVCFTADKKSCGPLPIKLSVLSEISKNISIKRVEHVPVKMPVYPYSSDSGYLKKTAGLYPDVLTPINSYNRLILSNNLESVFIEVDTKGIEKAGIYPIKIVFSNFDSDETLGEAVFSLELIDKALPPQELIFTQWFYCDCLMDYYKTKAFDERHWEIIENFLKTAVKGGINMILTPVFTPPLDTFVGGERTTTQLIDIEVNNGKYIFNFEKLERWIKLCENVGIKYFEISHFFTQWGAEHAPKIVACVNGREEKIFGWETNACGAEYTEFLKVLIPELIAFLKQLGVDKKCYFHISDEPNFEQLESYKAARDKITHLLEGYKIIDAISNYEFYSQGIVPNPIPSSDHIEPFIDNNVPDLWTYYCCCQHMGVSNRFIAMPSYRNRIIGVQMYKYGIKGFLHWGYNYYNCQYSYTNSNPYLSTDADHFTPAGDAFSVYPAPDGTAYESLRFAVFHDALQDMRAFSLCESLCGKEYVLNLIDEGLETEITFDSYPQDDNYLHSLREKVNSAIKNTVA